MASLPESPRWLLLSGRSAGEAGDALRRVQGSRLASDDAIEMRRGFKLRHLIASLAKSHLRFNSPYRLGGH
eukprot:scaffold103114_cov22-Tisochrysis_lutea.AAC.1